MSHRRRLHPSRATRALAALALIAAPLRPATAQLVGPTPYLGFVDSPFAGQPFSRFHLEDFEDGALDTPGVALLGLPPSILGPAPRTDSVDQDDGTFDGSGAGGHSLFTNDARTEFVFDFDAAALGGLPTHAGIVWTDVGTVTSGTAGVGAVTFEAFGPGLVSLGSTGPVVLGDGLVDGGTAEDRFFGAINAGGIARIRITMANSADWEVDHLQYGIAASTVPEPATAALLGGGLLVLLGTGARGRGRGRATASCRGSCRDS